MPKQSAVVDLERFPDSFSDEEAPTVLYGDRPTAQFAIPRDLLECTETSDSVAMRSADVSGIVPVAAASAEVVPAEVEAVQVHEEAFWDSAPRYSTTSVRPIAPFSLPPAPRPNHTRRLLAKVLFAALFSGAVTLLAYEALMKYGLHDWSDLRALVAKVR